MDERVFQNLPIYITGYNRLPFRTLSKDEVVQVSGVTEHMASVLSCAKHVSEATVRNICGNSFQPQLIEAALGSSDDLKAWITEPSLSNDSRAGMPAPEIIVKKLKLLESSSSELNSLVISKAKAKVMPKYRRIIPFPQMLNSRPRDKRFDPASAVIESQLQCPEYFPVSIRIDKKEPDSLWLSSTCREFL